MTDKNVVNREPRQKTISGLRTIVFLSLITNLYELYGFFAEGASVRQFPGIVLGFVGTVLLWQLAKQIQTGKKQAFYYWLLLLAVGMLRWGLGGAVFEVNVLSIILMAMVVVFSLRIVTWMRAGVLA